MVICIAAAYNTYPNYPTGTLSQRTQVKVISGLRINTSEWVTTACLQKGKTDHSHDKPSRLPLTPASPRKFT